METAGDYLKKEREAKNISLREVAHLTKISEFYLDYIEKDEYEKLPQGPYIKGFISNYCRSIGCNEDEVLKLYDALKSKKNETEEIQPETSRFKRRNRSIGASLNFIASSLNTAASSVKTTCTSLKAMVPSVRSMSETSKQRLSFLTAGTNKGKNAAASSIPTVSSVIESQVSTEPIESSIQKKTGSSKPKAPIYKRAALAVTTNRWITHRQIWFYACMALFCAGIPVIAGFGFYHLFVDDEHPPVIAESQLSLGRETLPQSAMNSQKSISPPQPEAVPESSEKTAQIMPGKELLPLQSPETDQKPSPALPAIPDREPVAGPSTPDAAESAINPRVLKATVCSDVIDMMPVGVDKAFPASVQRVYVWNRIEAKQIPSKIRHIYYHEGRKISDVTLHVRSPNWRTWSYKSISNIDYRGQWRVDITSEGGKVLESLDFAIQ